MRKTKSAHTCFSAGAAVGKHGPLLLGGYCCIPGGSNRVSFLFGCDPFVVACYHRDVGSYPSLEPESRGTLPGADVNPRCGKGKAGSRRN